MENLPVVLISAPNESSAARLISELVDDESIIKNSSSEKDTIWKFVNKYYTANVRVHSLIDGHQLEPGLRNLVEAHIIYLTVDEVNQRQCMSLIEKRCHISSECPSLDVRLLVTESKDIARLQAAAIASHTELVSLHCPTDDGEDADGVWGIGRIREALQAHMWHSAQLLRSQLTPNDDVELAGDDSSDDSWSSWQAAESDDVDGEGAESAEVFAGALRSLAGAAAAARALHSEESETDLERWTATRAERLARAEALVAAFCQALGPSAR